MTKTAELAKCDGGGTTLLDRVAMTHSSTEGIETILEKIVNRRDAETRKRKTLRRTPRTGFPDCQVTHVFKRLRPAQEAGSRSLFSCGEAAQGLWFLSVAKLSLRFFRAVLLGGSDSFSDSRGWAVQRDSL
jgi:hypothetical protein